MICRHGHPRRAGVRPSPPPPWRHPRRVRPRRRLRGPRRRADRPRRRDHAQGPIVLPMAYGRTDDWLYVHGSVANAALRAAVGQDICITVTIVDGMVVGRCPFHNSMNYRGVVVRGVARKVDDPDEHLAALRLVSDHVMPTWDTGRRAERDRDPPDDGRGRAARRDVGEDPRRRPDRRARGRRRPALGGPRADPQRVGGPGRRRPTSRRASPSRTAIAGLAGQPRVTRRNRVDPWGDLHADPARGLFTGNRGALVDDDRRIVRHHTSSTLWITCVLRFKDWRHPLDQPHVWTPLFFLDDAVALAAGHRPSATCRRADYVAYRDARRRRRPDARRRGSSTAAWRRSGCAAVAALDGPPTGRCGRPSRRAPRRHGDRPRRPARTSSGRRPCSRSRSPAGVGRVGRAPARRPCSRRRRPWPRSPAASVRRCTPRPTDRLSATGPIGPVVDSRVSRRRRR